jgi:hypothetical protein
MKPITHPSIGIAGGALCIGLLSGCVGYVEGPRARVHAPPPPPPIHVETAVVVHDDYVYYPAYEVYYSSSRHQYFYRDGSAWVSRPAPPRVSVNVLFASPSVRVDFHDSPANHHSRVVHQYPKHWSPPGHGKDNKNDHDNRRDDDKKNGGKGRK